VAVTSFIETQCEKDARLPAVLEAYASEVERRRLVDSDFAPVLLRAARLLRAQQTGGSPSTLVNEVGAPGIGQPQ
jgi:hypothetical protein